MSGNDYKEAYGIVDVDGLDVRTVSPTRRAAIVNWLVTQAHRFISTSHSDEQIYAMWDHDRGEALVRPVRIYVQ